MDTQTGGWLARRWRKWERNRSDAIAVLDERDVCLHLYGEPGGRNTTRVLALSTRDERPVAHQIAFARMERFKGALG